MVKFVKSGSILPLPEFIPIVMKAFLISSLAILAAALAPVAIPAQLLGLLPQPVSGAYGPQRKKHSHFNGVLSPSRFAPELEAFREDWPKLQSKTGIKVEIRIDRGLAEEEYRLSLGTSAKLRVGSPVAAAWALQTLGQLGELGVRRAEIHDKPNYAFRAVMVDVARRYHSLSTLRQIVRWCEAGKVRFIQLHLTDDQNWMLPTKVLAGVDNNNNSGHKAYTRKELLGLESFASARGISIIPELDIPGHSTLLVKFNPAEFSIKGSASSNCINFGSPQVIKTMQALIGEISNTFPDSPYIHVGGDEAWYPSAEKDPDIAKAMKEIGPNATPQDIFVDFISKMAEEVIAQKKTPIVWEGFGATLYAKSRIPMQTVVVAWDGGYYPAQRLISDKFRVVNAGWDPFYVVNHYPYDAYTLVPLPMLFSLNPKRFGVVDRGPGASGTVALNPSGNLLGSMLCWWEGYEWNAQSTLPLRILAFGDRLWSQSASNNYGEFLAKSKRSLKRIQKLTIPFTVVLQGTRSTNRLEFTDRAVVIAIAANPSLTLAMRSDGQTPNLDDSRTRLVVDSSAVVTIQAYLGTKPFGETKFLSLKKVSVVDNLAMGAKVTGSTPEDPQFPASLVTDGVSDDIGSYWLGYPNPCALTIDLGAPKQINRIDVVPFWAANQPAQYQVDVSTDGRTWTQVIDASKQSEAPTASGYVHRFPTQTSRFIRVRLLGSSQFPPTMARINEVRAFYEK